MSGVRFTTNAYPREQRRDAWRFALQRVSIDLVEASADVYGELVSFTTGQKIQFVRMAGTPQSVAIDFSQEGSCFWMVLLLEGRMAATSGATRIEVAEGDIVYGGGATRAVLELSSDHRLLSIKVPHGLPALRSRMPLPSDISNLLSDSVIGRMLSGLLRSVADTIVEVTEDQMRPVELALPEFISATLLGTAPAKALGAAAGGRAAILERVFQSVEMRLSDPDLGVHQIASEHGISSRYLQKLFESYGESFGQFVKLRRLERCRLDLGSPLHAQRSISEILFQWGFNDSASFSRAFRERYGISPREYRKAPDSGDARSEALRRGRPATVRDVKIEEQPESEPPAPAEAEPQPGSPEVRHHHLPVRPDTVHWGYFSRSLKPIIEVRSGDYVTVETLTSCQ